MLSDEIVSCDQRRGCFGARDASLRAVSAKAATVLA